MCESTSPDPSEEEKARSNAGCCWSRQCTRGTRWLLINGLWKRMSFLNSRAEKSRGEEDGEKKAPSVCPSACLSVFSHPQSGGSSNNVWTLPHQSWRQMGKWFPLMRARGGLWGFGWSEWKSGFLGGELSKCFRQQSLKAALKCKFEVCSKIITQHCWILASDQKVWVNYL